ncbi:hypothetical protein D9Q98_001348 [Chlorella vulgaris]|uniref:Charged multivesicular body protein 5 n=1 Tax=Chlorella vulgaris TaxID=3077 RepID=A0A9D4TZQ5_CHLVU|nr:hypothetical protein D9Q98_001348 [Chlorella vulgaris]
MKRLFGAKKVAVPAPTMDQAVDKLNTRGDTMDEKIRKLDEQLAKHRDIIKKTRPGPAQEAAKRRALVVLKQKRLYEGQRDQLYNQQFNVEQTSFAMTSMQDTVHTVSAMKAAGKEMKGFMKNNDLKIENIEKLHDEMSDMLDYHQEIQDVMGSAFGVPEDLDEEELMGELDALEDDLAAETTTGGSVPAYLQDVDLPEAPTGQVQPQQAQAADEFGLPAIPQRT